MARRIRLLNWNLGTGLNSRACKRLGYDLTLSHRNIFDLKNRPDVAMTDRARVPRLIHTVCNKYMTCMYQWKTQLCRKDRSRTWKPHDWIGWRFPL